MATTLGAKNSQRRKDLWSLVIHPLNNVAKANGLVAPFGHNSWLDAGATDATAKWKKVRELARDLSTLLGLSFSMATSMSTYDKAKAVVERIKAENKVGGGSAGTDADTSTDTSGAGATTTDPATVPVTDYTTDWGPDGTGTSTSTSTTPSTTSDLTPLAVEEGALSTGAKIGIAGGVVAFLTALGLLIARVRARRAA